MNRPDSQANPRDAAVAIVRRLQEAHHVAYLAGGCVRDQLLGLIPKDYDVATDATPEKVLQLFRGARLVGEAFGVALVRSMGHAIEVATFRCESGYTDGRRPSQVQFTDAQHDAQRRDFTINGLFENPLETDPQKRIIDFVDGQTDLQNKLIRAIGDPDERFSEDYLRLLRAVRFTARLGFTLDPATTTAIRHHARYLSQISRERIGMEVLAMLSGPRPVLAMDLIQQLRLDGPTLNEDHAEPTLRFSAKLPAPVPAPVALAAWMLDRHLLLPQASENNLRNLQAVSQAVDEFLRARLDPLLQRMRRALAMSNEHRDALQSLLQLSAHALNWASLPVARRKRLLAHPNWNELRLLLNVFSAITGGDEFLKTIDHESTDLFSQGVAPVPLLSGDDLIQLGLQPGPKFKQILDDVYDAQLEDKIRNKEEAMTWLQQTR